MLKSIKFWKKKAVRANDVTATSSTGVKLDDRRLSERRYSERGILEFSLNVDVDIDSLSEEHNFDVVQKYNITTAALATASELKALSTKISDHDSMLRLKTSLDTKYHGVVSQFFVEKQGELSLLKAELVLTDEYLNKLNSDFLTPVYDLVGVSFPGTFNVCLCEISPSMSTPLVFSDDSVFTIST